MLGLIDESCEYLKQLLPNIPDTVIVLGSGLGEYAESLKNMLTIEYKHIPNFPVSTVEGHKGRLVYGKKGQKSLLLMQGRFHYYEGYSFEKIAHPIRCFARLGIKNIVLTCAVGGINKNYSVGDLILINDHIKFFSDSPLRGGNINELGERFFDMSQAYSIKLREIAKNEAKRLGQHLKEGVYAFMGGPNYETPAEIRMLERLGADVVGMSTVPECITAVHCKMNVLCIACVTNMAAGVLDKPLDHGEVMKAGRMVSAKMAALIDSTVKKI